MPHSWDHDRAADHIDKKLDEVKTVEILDYTREMSLENIPTNKAYKVSAAHLYADILNLLNFVMASYGAIAIMFAVHLLLVGLVGINPLRFLKKIMPVLGKRP